MLFDRLAIFAGGFTLEAATEVCSDESLPSEDVLELLSSLIAQSLVTADFARGDARYHLLEATRQYGLEKLGKRGERQALGHRHALEFLRVAQKLDRDWYESPERSWFKEAEAELDNCRLALSWSLAERRDLRSGRLLAGALARVWYSLSPVEGRRWVRLAKESIDEETPLAVIAQLFIAEAELCGALGEYKASLASAESALALCEALDELNAARAMQAAGSALAALERRRRGGNAPPRGTRCRQEPRQSPAAGARLGRPRNGAFPMWRRRGRARLLRRGARVLRCVRARASGGLDRRQSRRGGVRRRRPGRGAATSPKKRAPGTRRRRIVVRSQTI